MKRAILIAMLMATAGAITPIQAQQVDSRQKTVIRIDPASLPAPSPL